MPFCRRQLGELEQRATAFRETRFPVVTVSVDTVELIRTFATAAHVSYRMLADPTGKVAQDTGIRDLQYVVGASAFGVPQPGIFVLAKDGKILATLVMQGYKVRPDPDEVLTAVRVLAQ